MSIATINKPGQIVPVKFWTPIHEVDSGAIDQLSNVARLPWVFHHVAVMPDVHAGKGCTVGSVIAMKDAVAPAAVGVDIGCGMGAVRTSLKASDLPESLLSLRLAIEAAIPVGFNGHEGAAKLESSLENHRIGQDVKDLFLRFKGLAQSERVQIGKASAQLGTLGGGNHFIEVCLDEDDRVWLMLHSGSRNIGKELAEIHIALAQKLIHNARIPDPDMAVFLSGTPEMKAYRNDLFWAQDYALLNRRVMFALLKQTFCDALGMEGVEPGFMSCFSRSKQVQFDEPILCHHNYVSEENHFGEDVMVTRKGAIRARQGELGIIPGSMGTRSYITRGLGNPESFSSASHGAGRKMSRGGAKRKFKVEDLVEQTAGVECRKDQGVLDEIPGAYKDIDQVMANQADLVEIVHTIKQVLCVKG
jgi:tRNA-splicing ligase RtcB (3'-phosphate/5'-hydroxy nucleic acid ligase)